MNIRIQAKDFSLTAALDAEVRKQVEQALARFDDYVVAVDVFLSDVNGPKGGPDKACVIRVQLPNRTTIPIETIRSDLYAAVYQSARRARRVVRRTLKKQRRFERSLLREMRYGETASG